MKSILAIFAMLALTVSAQAAKEAPKAEQPAAEKQAPASEKKAEEATAEKQAPAAEKQAEEASK